MKTIFITSLNPFVTRNILFTDVFKTLRAKEGTRFVIFCPAKKVDYFQKNFASPNVVIEGIESQMVSRKDIIFRFIGNNLLNNRTRYIHQRRELLKDKNYFKFLAARFVAQVGRLPFSKSLFRWAHYAFVNKKKFAEFFKKFKPDLVFAPDIFHDDDVRFLTEAKYRGIKTIGMVRSWDNITNKGVFRIKPDKLVVNNEIAKDEATRLEGMKEADIFVGGMPQFDYYLNEKRSSREEFFKRIQLDPTKRLIMFSPHGNRFHDTDWHIMQILKEAMDGGELPGDVQVLVRFPPNDDVDLGDFVPDERFYIDRPGKIFEAGVYRDQELDRQEMTHLADSLNYMDLLVTYNSSMIIDAAAFNKPAIGVAFDGWSKKPDIYRSIARFMEYDHTQYVLKTGGLWVVRSREELIKAINTYLQNPHYNEEARKKILETQAWKFDGQSGKRIGEFIHSQI